MSEKKTEIVPARSGREPFNLLRQMSAELDRAFDDWPSFRLPIFGNGIKADSLWAPRTDVFERDGKLVARVDLPGMKKEDVVIEASDGQLTLSGERKKESEEKKDDYYRREREYGSFYRAIPLPQGTRLDEVKANFADGVLEVSVPLPALAAKATRKVHIEDGKSHAKA